jgi:pseudouridylate synthase / pseudouridine kinase
MNMTFKVGTLLSYVWTPLKFDNSVLVRYSLAPLSTKTADINYSEPTSVIKSTAIIPVANACLNNGDEGRRSPVSFASPNLSELAQMHAYAQSDPWNLTARPNWWSTIDKFSLGSEFRTDLEQLARRNVSDESLTKGTLSFLTEKGVAQMAINLLPLFQNIVIKCGGLGLVVALRISGRDITRSGWAKERSNAYGRYIVAHGKGELLVLQHFAPHVVEKGSIVNVTGAGDSLVGSILASLILHPDAFLNPMTLAKCIDDAQQSAVLTLQSPHAVSPSLSKRL